jgi:hypothetical protein
VSNGDDVDIIVADSVHNKVRKSANGQLTYLRLACSRGTNFRMSCDEIKGVRNGIEQSGALRTSGWLQRDLARRGR